MGTFERAQAVGIINGAYDGQVGVIVDYDPSYPLANSVIVHIPGLGCVQLPCWYIAAIVPAN